MAKHVIVYAQPGRLFCHKVKEFLSQRGVAFAERDVPADEAALKELEQLHLMTTPVTKIDGEVVGRF